MNSNAKYDVVVVGGGASGLAAAIELGMSSAELSVLIIEKMDEPGRKLRATGSGRCNITNSGAAGYNRIVEFFTRIGLVTREYANGLVYPYSESAADVVELLIKRAEQLGVEFRCGETVTSIKKHCNNACAQMRITPQAGRSDEQRAYADNSEGNGRAEDNNRKLETEDAFFEIESVYKDEKGEHRVITKADCVVLACGGKAGPSYGTTGDGYALARALGHSIVTPVPVLTGIECREWDEWPGPAAVKMAGTRTAAVISLYREDGELPVYDPPYFDGEYSNIKPLFSENGELQFTKYGLSGICVFNMTRHMRFNKDAGERLDDFYIKVNLLPGASIAEHIMVRQEGEFSDAPASELLCSILKKPVAEYVMDMFAYCSGLRDGETEKKYRQKRISDLDTKDIRLLSELIHGLDFRPSRLRGWKDAQATSGGVSLSEIDEETSASKIVPGLYITGELADRDFPCGGFNLSNAWISGLSAAYDISAQE